MLKKISEAVTPITMGASTTPQAPISNTTTIPKSPQQNQQISAIANKVEKAISESGDLITALEHVGAMYGIPPSNIIADDTATGIRIMNGNIIAPPMKNPINQIEPIVCAISAVLDLISQRIDDKLDNYQMNNIEQGRIADSIANNANPAKGKVIGRYEDDEGGEILAYDSGLVDMPNTPAARAKVDELRATNTIPSYDPSKMSKTTYFSEDEDDITTGVDMNASANDTEIDNIEVNDVTEQIQESAYHLDMISRLNNTRHLGCDLLNRHGFTFVKPIDSFYQESKSDDDEKSKKKKVRVDDIKFMKFDNKNILDAVKYFNKAREEQDTARNGKMDLKEFINNSNYEKAIHCLNKQFDCHITLRFFTTPKGLYENTGTLIYDDLKKKIHISKSKGFQLGGLPIDIQTYNHYFENSSPENIELFGQTLVSTICHEIFHNIAFVLRKESIRSNMSLTMTIHLASNAKTIKERRIIITNYVNTLDNISDNKLFNKAIKRKMIKQLMALTTVQNDEKLVKEIQKSVSEKNKDASDKYIDSLIKKYKKNIKNNKPSITRYIFPVVATAVGIIGCCIGSGAMLTGGAIAAGIGGVTTLSFLEYDAVYAAVKKSYKNSNLYEEYYCDLFAAMYKLPKFFFVGPSKKGYVANDFKDEKLNQLTKLEKEFYESIFCSYPTDSERSYAGVKIAKKLLDDKSLDPSLKKYCQWIVDNFSSLEKTDIKEIYNTTTFDPEEAENLDKHLEDLIKDNNITITESFKTWINSEDVII